jgi:hypothetical protein
LFILRDFRAEGLEGFRASRQFVVAIALLEKPLDFGGSGSADSSRPSEPSSSSKPRSRHCATGDGGELELEA